MDDTVAGASAEMEEEEVIGAGEEEQAVEGEEGEREAEGEGEEEVEEEALDLEFDEGTNPLDLVQAGGGVELYQQFERLEYEAIAERKRKALPDHLTRDAPAKKARQEEFLGATMEEIDELMNFGGRRRSRAVR